MPPGSKSRPQSWEPGVPDVSDAGTEAPDMGAPPPMGSGAVSRTSTLPRPIPPQFTGATLDPAAAAPPFATTGNPPPAAPSAPARGRSPVVWALIAVVASLLSFGLAFGVATAIILATR